MAGTFTTGKSIDTMKIQVFSTYDDLSLKAAEDLTQFLALTEKPLLCVASGDSPSGLYKKLAEKVKNNETDISNWHFVGLDEWMGMNGEDAGSCRFHLNKQFFDVLQIEEQRISFFDGRTSNPGEECRRVDNFIQQQGGIDVAVLGLGMNGHVGMNEPGTLPVLRSHLADIAPQTQQIGQKYFTDAKILSQGLTLGIQTLKEAKHIMLIVNGAHKASIVEKVLEEKISDEIPATLLRNHPGLTIYLDKSAAQFIISYE